jgi:predicted aconitase with swiveling domain
VTAPRAIVLTEPLSLWGGMDPATGELIDPHHPQRGANLCGRVVVMPAGRGSSSSASVLAEAVRAGAAPAAFVLVEPDLILSVGAAVAEELYRVRVPIVVLDRDAHRSIRDGEPFDPAGADAPLVDRPSGTDDSGGRRAP